MPRVLPAAAGRRHARADRLAHPVSTIIAAGAVLWRPGDSDASESAADERASATDDPEICLVHRPRHNDWSLPKGKVEPGEHVLTTAVREVHEETGHHVTLGRPLPVVQYKVGGRHKSVHFWAARANDTAPPWEATSEVDEVRFRPAARALEKLSYDDERAVLRAFLDDPRPTIPLVLLRHTKALPRDIWNEDDALRPLSAAGRAAAKSLISPLSALGVERVVSSDAVRCSETVSGLAGLRGIEPELDSVLSEHGHTAAPERSRAIIRKIVADGRPTVVCSHRPVLPELLAAATEGTEVTVPTGTLPPGGFHVVHIANGAVITIDTFEE